MAIYYSRVNSDEIVLLPGDKLGVLGSDSKVGPHSVVISGRVLRHIPADDDDDVTRTDDLIFDIKDILWEYKFLQASSILAWGEIYSADSDEVDHSRWGVRTLVTGHAKGVASGKAVKILRIHAEIVTQGELNGWDQFRYQVIANGTLVDPDSVSKMVNETTEVRPDLLEELQRRAGGLHAMGEIG